MRDWSEVKAICEKATEEPWELAGCNGELTGINGPSGYDHEMGIMPGQLEVYGGDDAIFISVTRTALPEAIAEIEQLRQKLQEHETTCEDAIRPMFRNAQLAQEKAELVEALRWVMPRLECLCEDMGLVPPDEDLPKFIKCTQLLARLEGGESNE